MTVYDHDHDREITYFAATNFRNQMLKFGIKTEDRRRHVYILGKTGSGKTTLEANMALQDIERGHGMCLVDPHGDVLNSVLDYIPSHRVNDVIYFNPSDTAYPIAFNILENINPEHKHLVASGLMSVFKKIWANLWSARMEYILNNCILALLDSPGNTLLGIMRILTDKDFRRKIVDNIKDPVVKSFWVNEYANYQDRFRQEAIAPIQNKVGQFLSSAVIRNIVGQTKSTIEPRKIIDEGKILLLDLAKGKIGEDNSSLLGAMMITKIWLAAMSRVDIPENERLDFYLYVDEFQNFATESFADILSEARKYRLNLTVAHQYIAQLVSPDSTRVKDAVFGNVGTIICFRVGGGDAKELIKEFEPTFLEEDLVNIGKHEIFLKLMIDGMASAPFSAKTLPPLSTGRENKNREKIVRISRERYSNTKEEVEEKIMRWSGVEEMFKETAKSEYVDEEKMVYKETQTKTNNLSTKIKVVETKPGQVQTDDKKHLDAFCDNCGQPTRINFLPDLSKSIFCRDCLKEFKKGSIDPHKLKSKNGHLSDIVKQQKAGLEPTLAVSEGAILSPQNTKVLEKSLASATVTVPPSPDQVLTAKIKKAKINFLDNLKYKPEEISQSTVGLDALKDINQVVPFNKIGTKKESQKIDPGQVIRF
ncbi:MAG TPA: type IV secretion system DNA-binding domain-containing protein [bacterium]|nr:type IV secretion system DNA-binding domain-containing protein [bacterium]